MRTYSEEYTVTYKRRAVAKSKRNRHRNNSKTARNQHSSWNKVFYGRHIGKRLYYTILEQYDSGIWPSIIAVELNVSTAMVDAVVNDRRKALPR